LAPKTNADFFGNVSGQILIVTRHMQVGAAEMNDAFQNKAKERPSHREYKTVASQTDEPYPTQTALIARKSSQSLWGLYLEANRRRPLLTKSLTTGVLTLLGNASAQYIMINKGKQTHIVLRKVRIRLALSEEENAMSND
jgi:hypothetical protein